MGLKVYMNGDLVDQADAKVSVYDHGLLYGDGVFEGIRVYHGRIFRCAEHIDRLYTSAEAIRLNIPLTKQEMTDAMYRTLEANGLSEAYIRLIVTRGAGTLGLDPFKCSQPQVVIITDSIELYPQELYEEGLSLITCSVLRNHPKAMDASVKSLNYLNNILAKIECLEAGTPEGIMLNVFGNVAECTGDNIFIVKGDHVLTPPVAACILVGVTRQVVMELADRDGLKAEAVDLTPDEIYSADECFLTGTAAEIIPVVKVDGKPIGDGKPGPVTARLLSLFREEVRNNPD